MVLTQLLLLNSGSGLRESGRDVWEISQRGAGTAGPSWVNLDRAGQEQVASMRDKEAQDCPGPGGDTVRPHGQGKTCAKIAEHGGETEAASPAPSCPRAGGGGGESHLVAEDLRLMVGGWHRAGGGSGQQAAQAWSAAGGGECGAQHAELSGA